jgi:hypothetical protein
MEFGTALKVRISPIPQMAMRVVLPLKIVRFGLGIEMPALLQ